MEASENEDEEGDEADLPDGLMYLKNLMKAMQLTGKALETLSSQLFLLPGFTSQTDGASQIVASRQKMFRKFR